MAMIDSYQTYCDVFANAYPIVKIKPTHRKLLKICFDQKLTVNEAIQVFKLLHL